MDWLAIAYILTPALIALAVAAGVDDWYDKMDKEKKMTNKELSDALHDYAEQAETRGKAEILECAAKVLKHRNDYSLSCTGCRWLNQPGIQHCSNCARLNGAPDNYEDMGVGGWKAVQIRNSRKDSGYNN